MGVIPLCFKQGEDAETLNLTGYERYSIDLPSNVKDIRPGQDVSVVTDSGKTFVCTVRFDTEVVNHISYSSTIMFYAYQSIMRTIQKVNQMFYL